MPEYRRMGYATEMLNQALEICKTKIKQSKMLVTCDKINIASMHTIIKCGGILSWRITNTSASIAVGWNITESAEQETSQIHLYKVVKSLVMDTINGNSYLT